MSQYLCVCVCGGVMGEHQIAGIRWGQFTELPAILSKMCGFNMHNIITFWGCKYNEGQITIGFY